MEIEVNSKKHGIQKCLIDDEDFWLIKNNKLWLRKSDDTFYVNLYYNKKQISLHRFLMGNPKGFEIDHRNHNGLDNQRSNIRIATKAQNGRNRILSKANTSSFKGVRWVKEKKAWKVAIDFNGKTHNAGYFDCKIDAAHKYNELAIKYFGEFAYLNTITKEQELIRLHEKRPPVNGMRRKSKCIFKGVDKLSDSCYAARVSVNGKKKHLGCFKTGEDAALAYNEYVSKVLKLNRDLNKV